METEAIVELAGFLGFDEEFYSKSVGIAGEDALAHFMQFGRFEGRFVRPFVAHELAASVAFQEEVYCELNIDVRDAVADPWDHFITFGLREFRPTARFEVGEREFWDTLGVGHWRSLTFSEKIETLEISNIKLLAATVRSSLNSPEEILYRNNLAKLLAKSCLLLEWPTCAAAFLSKYREGLAFCVPPEIASPDVIQICEAMQLQSYCESRNLSYCPVELGGVRGNSQNSGLAARLERAIVSRDGSIKTSDHVLLTDVCWSGSVLTPLQEMRGPRHRAVMLSRSPRPMSGEFLSLLRAGQSGPIDCVVDAFPRLLVIIEAHLRLHAVSDLALAEPEVDIKLAVPEPVKPSFLSRQWAKSLVRATAEPVPASDPIPTPDGAPPAIVQKEPLVCLISPPHLPMAQVFLRKLQCKFDVDLRVESMGETDGNVEILFVSSAIGSEGNGQSGPPFSDHILKLRNLLSDGTDLPTGSGVLLHSDEPRISGLANGTEIANVVRRFGIESIAPDWRRAGDLIAAISRAPVLAVGSATDAAALIFAPVDATIFLLGLRHNEFDTIRALVKPLGARLHIVRGILANEAIKVDASISYIDRADFELALNSAFGDDVFATLFKLKVEKITSKVSETPILEVLSLLKNEGQRLYSSSSAFGRPCMSIELDQCCFNIGAAYRSAHGRGEKSRPGVRAYYATELYKTGGHTRLIEELIAARPDDEHHVICAAVPDLDAGWGLNLIFRPVVPATIHIVSLDLNKRLADAMGILAKVRPETLFHLAHSDDPVGTALLQPNNADRFVLVHHNDHSFSLGPSRPELVHITVHPRSKRDVEKLIGRDTVYIPMTSSDGPSVRWQPGEPLLTVTSGSQNKFSSHDGRRYIDLLRVRLIGREGQHIHIGPLDPQFYTTLKGELDLQGVGGRFIHVAFVESLSDALRKLRPHLYLNSYPIGGGHALVDAMAVGLPIAAGCYNSNFDSSEIPYRGHLSWKHLGELQLALQRFTEDERERHKNLALEHFNEVHAPYLFKDRVQEFMSRMSFEEKCTQ